MDERLRFVARLLEGEKMAPLCAQFGISRKTGYKIFDRYKDCGLECPGAVETTAGRLRHAPIRYGFEKVPSSTSASFWRSSRPAIVDCPHS